MHGPDQGFTPGEDLRERSTSESRHVDMESGQGKSEGSHYGEINQYRKLIRALLVEALRDMGRFGTTEDRASVRRYVDTEGFKSSCDFLGWGDTWVRSMFIRVYDLPPCVSMEIARQCVHMLKSLPLGEER